MPLMSYPLLPFIGALSFFLCTEGKERHRNDHTAHHETAPNERQSSPADRRQSKGKQARRGCRRHITGEIEKARVYQEMEDFEKARELYVKSLGGD